jgi:hypothetical protein
MKRIDPIGGTSARQLDLLDEDPPSSTPHARPQAPRPRPLRLLQRDVYAELARRRRRAQIAARKLVE